MHKLFLSSALAAALIANQAQAQQWYAPARPYYAPHHYRPALPTYPPAHPVAPQHNDGAGWVWGAIVLGGVACVVLGCFSEGSSSGGAAMASQSGGVAGSPDDLPPEDQGNSGIWSNVKPAGPLYGPGPGGSFYGNPDH